MGPMPKRAIFERSRRELSLDVSVGVHILLVTVHVSFIGVRLSIKGGILFLLGCGTYFIKDNTIQYSITVVVIIYHITSNVHT